MPAVVALVGAGAIVTLLSGATHGSPDPSTSQASTADRLRALEHRRLEALVDADTATARATTSGDFQLINPGGGELSREDYLGAVDAGTIDYRVLEPTSSIAIRMSGHSAVLRYQMSFDLVINGSTRLEHEGWVTELYELRRGRWRIVWEQATAIPNDFDLFVQSLEPVA